MNRRQFLQYAGFAASGGILKPRPLQTRHAIWVINGGSRKLDWYQNTGLSPNFARLANEGFVYEESHNDSVARHESARAELFAGLDSISDCRLLTNALADASTVLKHDKPRLIICHETGFDVGHLDNGYSRYLEVCRSTDHEVGKLRAFITNDPYFSTNTAIIIRPEFGRDDIVNQHGALHHSEGFYQTHRSAEIWWGPDFKRGVSKAVINRRDFAPSLTALLNVRSVLQ